MTKTSSQTLFMIMAAAFAAACGGSDGSDGEAGTTGEPGANGTTGTTGSMGAMGADGVDGTNPSAQELDDAINAALDMRAAPAAGCDSVDLAPPAAGQGVQVSVAMPLAAGEEKEVCQLVMVEQGFNLNWSEGLYSTGSHHGLVQRTVYRDELPTETVAGEVIDPTGVIDCGSPSAMFEVSSVIAGGQAIGATTSNVDGLAQGVLPDNVAFPIEDGEVLVVNFHMINATDEPIDACYKANLHAIPDAQVEQEAGLIFFYNGAITVPPSGTSDARMACPVTQDVTLLSAVSHMHSRGVGYTSRLLTGDPLAGGTEVQKLHETTDWEHPVTDVFDPGLALTQGQWIEWTCNFENQEAREIAQGLQTTDEMCMFVGAYYPYDPNFEFCAPTLNTAGLDGRWLGTGTMSGADFLGCWWASPQQFFGGGEESSADRYATQECITGSCPAVSGLANAYLQCLTSNAASCQSQCTDALSSFQAVCARTPSADGGCASEFGTNGSDGTCAAQALPAAITACTTTAQSNALREECEGSFCAAACSGTDPAACNACVGAFDAANPPPANPTCLNSLTWACVGDQAGNIGEACVTECFTDCITAKVTDCTVDCLHEVSCASEYTAVASATCN